MRFAGFRQYQAPRPDEVNCKIHETLAFQEWSGHGRNLQNA